MGTWFEAQAIDRGRVEGKTTFKADGSFHSLVTFIGLDERNAAVLTISGTWFVQDELLIMKVVKTENSADPADEVGKLVAFFMAPMLRNSSHSEKIVSVSETHLITQDPATGTQSVAERVR